MAIPEVLDILKSIEDIHKKKNEDYAADGKPFENFERSADVASWFSNASDKPFVVLIATKLARLATLLTGRKPNNESIDDSFLDLCTYCILWWASYHRRSLQRDEKTVGSIIPSHVMQSAKDICPMCMKSFVHSGIKTTKGIFCSDKCLGDWNDKVSETNKAQIL